MQMAWEEEGILDIMSVLSLGVSAGFYIRCHHGFYSSLF